MSTLYKNVKTSRTSKHFCQQRQRQQKPCHMLRRQQQAAITIAATAAKTTTYQPATIATISEGQQQSCIKAQKATHTKGQHAVYKNRTSSSVCLRL